MNIYVWEEEGGYGAAAVVVLANDLQQARLVAEQERLRLERHGDAKTKAWQERKERGRPLEDWVANTDEGKAWDKMPDGGLMATTSVAPTRTIFLGDATPRMVSNCWYYE
jgi:hypothetical protein